VELIIDEVPPRWATRILQWYCAPHLLEEVQRDLQEEFDYQVQRVGPKRARMDYPCAGVHQALCNKNEIINSLNLTSEYEYA
jgi:hypothetical protein